MKHVLIVEDNLEAAFLIQVQLSRLKYLSSVCIDPFIVLKKVEDGLVDALTIDVMLGSVNGIALTKHIRQINPKIPIIIITAMATEDVRIQALQAGANWFLTKPYSLSELKTILNLSV